LENSSGGSEEKVFWIVSSLLVGWSAQQMERVSKKMKRYFMIVLGEVVRDWELDG
jgi:hypothetical protein